MITKKRILVTLLVSVLFTFTFTASVFAEEADQNGSAPVQEAVIDNSNNEGNSSDTQNTAVLTDGQASAQETTDADQVQVNDDGSYIDADGQLYVVDYVDEQGQVYYKKAEEPALDDTTAITDDDTAAVTEVDTEEAAVKETAAKDEEKEVKADKEKKDKPVVTKPSYSEQDLRLLACLIYSEARNQSYNGMLGVANVVLNRTHSNDYYYIHTVKEAIYDKKWSVQFAVTIKNSNGVSLIDKALKAYDTGKYTGSNPGAEKAAMQKAIKAAKAALQGKNNIGSLLCFQNVRSASYIKKRYSEYKIIGDHIFYRAE